jgi:hypothetical protein
MADYPTLAELTARLAAQPPSPLRQLMDRMRADPLFAQRMRIEAEQRARLSYPHLFDPDLIKRLTPPPPVFDTSSGEDDAEPVKRTRKLTIPDNVGPDTMLRLETAAELGFPDGSMTVAGLRREAEAGHLTIYLIANKHYTTLADIEGLKASCRVQAKVQGSACKKQETDNASGSSATASEPSAQAALKATAQALRKRLQRTSPASTTPKPAAAAVIPMPSRSRTP